MDLPHRRHLLIEHVNDPLNTADGEQVILHTLWGGRINRPFSLAMQAAWQSVRREEHESAWAAVRAVGARAGTEPR